MVDGDGNLVLGHPFGGLTFKESIQQDYAVMAMEHIEDLTHREQQILQRALGSQTLTNFAYCCASRIMVPEPLSVSEAEASEHAAEWRAAMDEEILNLQKFGVSRRYRARRLSNMDDSLSRSGYLKSSTTPTTLFSGFELGSWQRVSPKSLEVIFTRLFPLCSATHHFGQRWLSRRPTICGLIIGI